MTDTTSKKKMSPRPRKEIDTSTYSGRFAARLRALRDNAGMTVPELAEKCGIPESTLFHWECGKRSPVNEEFPALAEALGVKTRTLFPEK
jgi:transcriptional regulator with XRE-family HTH domain